VDIDGNATNTFGFMNVCLTEVQLKRCLDHFSSTAVKGVKLAVQIAKESFISRLKREREGSSVEDKKGVPAPTTPVEASPAKKTVSEKVKVKRKSKSLQLNDTNLAENDHQQQISTTSCLESVEPSNSSQVTGILASSQDGNAHESLKKKKKRKEKNKLSESKETEVSEPAGRERFYFSEELANSLKGGQENNASANGSFSLLKLFGKSQDVETVNTGKVYSTDVTIEPTVVSRDKQEVETAAPDVKTPSTGQHVMVKPQIFPSFFFKKDDQRLKDGVAFFNQPLDFDFINAKWPKERSRLKFYLNASVKNLNRKNQKRTSSKFVQNSKTTKKKDKKSNPKPKHR